MLSLPPVLIFPLSIGALFWGSDQFIRVAVEFAQRYKINRMLVGVVIVGILTAIPELIVSLMASMDGKVGIALGNAIGSYIVNIGLVLGLTALLFPITIKISAIKKEFIALLWSLLLVIVVLRDHFFSNMDAILLLVSLWIILVVGTMWCLRMRDEHPVEREILTPAVIHNRHGALLILQLIFGFALMLVSSDILVSASVELAKYFAVPEYIIGVSAVAIGTSVPELAASIVGVMRGEHEIAIGNVIGSNIFGLLAVLAMPGLFAPGKIIVPNLNFDLFAMAFLTLVLWLALRTKTATTTISRWDGAIMLLGFVTYMILSFQ